MRPRGEDTASAVREWIKEEIKTGPASRQDLGKFFFTASSGALGVLVAIANLRKLPLSLLLVISLSILFISLVVSILMVIPSVHPLTGESDLYDEHKKSLERIVRETWVWFALWSLGLVVGIARVMLP